MFSRREIITDAIAAFSLNYFGDKKLRPQDYKIIKVTNGNFDGIGSLKFAIEQNFPRKIIFETAGIIDLNKQNLVIKNPDLIICGETAPNPGICLIKGGINISANNVYIRHISVRPGDAGMSNKSGFEPDGIAITAANNIIIENCSISWAIDECLSASGPRFNGANLSEWQANTSHNIIFKNNIIAHALHDSSHAKGPHSMGSLIHDNVRNIQIIGNLYASNNERNPLLKGGASALIANNIFYNPGNACVQYTLVEDQWAGKVKAIGNIDLINNIMISGPDTKKNLPMLLFGGSGDLDLCAKGNLIKNSMDAKLIDYYEALPNGMNAFATYKAKANINLKKEISINKNFNPIATNRLENYVYSKSGARPWDRSKIDKNLIIGVKYKNAKIINSQEQVGGYDAI